MRNFDFRFENYIFIFSFFFYLTDESVDFLSLQLEDPRFPPDIKYEVSLSNITIVYDLGGEIGSLEVWYNCMHVMNDRGTRIPLSAL